MLSAFALYTLRVGALLAAFYLLFKLLLSRETLHRLNRVVVLSVLVLSFVLPFCVVTIRQEIPFVEQEPTMATQQPIEVEAVAVATPFPWEELLGVLFVVGAVVVLLRVVGSAWSLWRVVRRGERRLLDDGTVVVEATHPQTPFSWFGYVVVGRGDLSENGETILLHERAHIRLGHSWDLFLFDVLGTMQWFNPALWLLRRDLRAIHEYEADRVVLASGVDARHYQLLLIKKAAGERWYSVANSFNHSKLKNRITMMIQKRSSRWAAAKALLLLPLVGVALGAFAETVYVVTDDKGTTKNEISQPEKGQPLQMEVRDDKGNPIVGAIIVKEGTVEGACTDLSGRVTMEVKVGDCLVCSYIGKETLRWEVKELSAEPLRLTLKTEPQSIDEIVVRGYSATPAAKDEEAVPFMLVDDEDVKIEIGQAHRELESAKQELETKMEEAKSDADEEVFLIVEQMPKFQGGNIDKFRQWVQMRVQYPKELQEQGISGRVVVSFEVNETGEVTNVKTLATPDRRLSEIVENLVKQSPKWEPGRQRSQLVNVAFTMPIVFQAVTDAAPQTSTTNGVTPSVPDFAGGTIDGFRRWVQERVVHPADAKKEGVGGKVFVTFVVKPNGKIGDVDIIGEADKRLAKEVVRVVKSSPKWTPATNNSEHKFLRSKVGITVNFPLEDENTPFLVVEQMPTFEGGDINAFRRWVEEQIQPQTDDAGKPLEGMVIISFVIERDGSLSELTALRSPDKRLLEEATRIVKNSPRWEPGRQRGQTVRVKVTLPVQFKA